MANHNCPSCGKWITYPQAGFFNQGYKDHVKSILEYNNLPIHGSWKCLDCLGHKNCVRCGRPIDEELGVPYCTRHIVEEVFNKQSSSSQNSSYDNYRANNIMASTKSFKREGVTSFGELLLTLIGLIILGFGGLFLLAYLVNGRPISDFLSIVVLVWVGLILLGMLRAIISYFKNLFW